MKFIQKQPFLRLMLTLTFSRKQAFDVDSAFFATAELLVRVN